MTEGRMIKKIIIFPTGSFYMEMEKYIETQEDTIKFLKEFSEAMK